LREMRYRENSGDLLHLLPYDDGSMLRLAMGTGVVVSIVLLVPDAVAIIPTSLSMDTYLAKCLGIWLSVYIQWTVVFLGILKLAGLVNRGIIIDGKGIKLSRFGRRITWKQISGLQITSRDDIGRLLFLAESPLRVRLLICEPPDSRKSESSKPGKLTVRNLDSLLVSRKAFRQLIRVICLRSFSCPAPDADAFIGDISYTRSMAGSMKRAELYARLLPIYLTVMMLAYIGKTSTKNFYYNCGMACARSGETSRARAYFQKSLHVEPRSAQTLERLAFCDLVNNDPTAAIDNLRKALELRPESISARVSLVELLLQKGQREEAEKLLSSAICQYPGDVNLLKAERARFCFDRVKILSPEHDSHRRF
jgi:hypothetical protein